MTPTVALLCALALVPASAASRPAAEPAPARLVSPAMDARVKAGIDAILRMRFDAAQKEFEALKKLAPEHPYAYFGFASVAWVRYIYGPDKFSESLLAPFDAAVDEAVRRGNAWVRAHPKDAEGWMALGAIHGLRARLLVVRGSWVKAYMNARAATKSVRRSVDIDPELYDAYLGLGMWDYYTDVYPRFVSVLARLVLRGDRARGLRLTAEKGRYMSDTAKMILVEIHNNDRFGDKDPEESVRLMADVRSRYPDSGMLHEAQLISLYEARRYQEAAEGAKEFLARVSAGRYASADHAKGLVILGTALWMLDRKEPALRAFREAESGARASELSRWVVWGAIRAGNAGDLLGRREEAIESYRLAASAPDRWGLRKLASRRLAKPYSPENGPWRIIPD